MAGHALMMCLMMALVPRMRLVPRMTLMLLLLRLVLLVGHDGVVLHRLAHGAREEHGRGVRLSLRLRRHLLPRRCGALSRHGTQPAVKVAAGCPGRSIRDVAIDLRVV